ncbi:MAG TPA: hypothetical protein VGK29_02605 [Paludibaculum sp.]
MLRPLVAKRTILNVEIPERTPLFVLAAMTGSGDQHHYDDWRFNTRVAGIRAAYYERWRPVDAKRQTYSLERGYLHLFLRCGTGRDAGEEQILALHCDPNESEDAKHSPFKRGPHLHITAAGSPLCRSHIALNYSHLNDVLCSFESLCKAWDNAIELIGEQVLTLY